jgi:hypothetical protein
MMKMMSKHECMHCVKNNGHPWVRRCNARIWSARRGTRLCPWMECRVLVSMTCESPSWARMRCVVSPLRMHTHTHTHRLGAHASIFYMLVKCLARLSMAGMWRASITFLFCRGKRSISRHITVHLCRGRTFFKFLKKKCH